MGPNMLLVQTLLNAWSELSPEDQSATLYNVVYALVALIQPAPASAAAAPGGVAPGAAPHVRQPAGVPPRR